MDMKQIIDRAKQNIQKALEDYARHTERTDIMEDCTKEFIERLAHDSSHAKQDLRNLFSKSPSYDPEIDAIVLNGTRTHNPDYALIGRLIRQMLNGVWGKEIHKLQDFQNAFRLFEEPNLDETQKQVCIESINRLAPKAYSPTKKLSRVFKALCKAQGVDDETAGSQFQKLYARFADELSSRKINYKIYISINPAHFITMSNPKDDKRGETLVSCHSFNSTEYQYNNGCTGYARDGVTFLVFTVADPTEPETLNNRKITRQVFAYKPGNGLLLQSRLYNTLGGQTRMTEESKLYRNLVQREITTLEGGINLWKTQTYENDDHEDLIQVHEDFGGYTDWTHTRFEAKISFRKDKKDSYESMIIGEIGLCIKCAKEINEYLYCEDCDENVDRCQECDEIDRGGNLVTVYDYDRDENIEICRECRENKYEYCSECDEYHRNEDVVWIDHLNINVCSDCLDRKYTKCNYCDEYYGNRDIERVLYMKGEYYLKCNKACEHCLNGIEAIKICEVCGGYYDSEKIEQCHTRKTEVVNV